MSMFTLHHHRPLITKIEDLSPLTCRRIGAGLLLLSTLVSLSSCSFIFSLL